jgi:hypothetical protein
MLAAGEDGMNLPASLLGRRQLRLSLSCNGERGRSSWGGGFLLPRFTIAEAFA